jgi:hypothetical protein
MTERPARSIAADPTPIGGTCDHVDEGGDPPCWAHIFDEAESEMHPARATDNGVSGTSSTPTGDIRPEQRP